MARPSHPPRLDYSNYSTWRRVQITELFIMQFSPLSRHLISLGPNILLSTLFSNTLSLCSSLNVRDQFAHPYRTTGKIIVLYILIFIFFDATNTRVLNRQSQEEDKRRSNSVVEWEQTDKYEMWRMVRWTGNDARMRGTLVGKPYENRPFEICRYRRKDNIKIGVQNICCGRMDWIH
jgi:hypothetical protein